MFAWGSNVLGALGVGRSSNELPSTAQPTPIARFADAKPTLLSCGAYHTIVATDDNRLYGWGSNNDFQVLHLVCCAGFSQF